MFYSKTAYGISDKIADYYVLISIMCAIAVTVAIIIIIPNNWYIALIVAPMAAWAGPVAILLPVSFLEVLIYNILHFKESYRNLRESYMDIVQGILFLAFLAGSMLISFGIVRFCAMNFATPDPSTWEFAYVSESPNARCYHYSEDCKALRRTYYDIETLSVDEAEDYDYEPCSFCLKESAHKKWDNAIGFLFMPVSCLMYWLINKIGLFNKKYKFRNPIVKR